MRKILLVEDRVERQKKFMEESGILLNEYKNILDRVKIIDKNFPLDRYSTIITHRSAFGDSRDNILDYLKSHCEETKTKLVFFSGGISSTFYSKEKYEFLLLNSKSFYSKNLKIFLDEFKTKGEANILLLGYGDRWKIDILLNILEKINLFIEKNSNRDRVKFNRFKNETKIDTIKGLISFEYPEIGKGNGVFLKDLRELSNNIEHKIYREIEFYE
jgi:hypothetical protein